MVDYASQAWSERQREGERSWKCSSVKLLMSQKQKSFKKMFELKLWWVTADSFSSIYLSRLIKKKKKVSTYSPFSIIKWNTLIWSKRTCRRGRSQREDCSRQLLSFYATVTFNAARSGGKTPLLCENWVERQTDKRRHEERAERGEKPRKTTHSREGRYYFSMNVSVSSTLHVIRKSLSNRLHASAVRTDVF